MNNDYLSQLQDIQLPEQVSWWPLAWGWWVLIALTCALLFFAVRWLLSYHQYRRAKKACLAQLKSLPTNEPLTAVKQINDLLKRVCLVYGERSKLAALSGDSWALWLNKNSKGVQISKELLSLAYQPECTEQQASQLKQQAEKWIKQNLPNLPREVSLV